MRGERRSSRAANPPGEADGGGGVAPPAGPQKIQKMAGGAGPREPAPPRGGWGALPHGVTPLNIRDGKMALVWGGVGAAALPKRSLPRRSGSQESLLVQ